MIGTRNEKVLIVLTSYIIGFTTAFIAFGVSSDVDTPIAEYVAPKESISYKEIHQNIQSIGTSSEGLFVNVGGYERIISASLSVLSASAIQSTGRQGYAFKHHTPLVSKDGWFAFYCEQEDADDTTCVPYVYSLFDDTVHPVTLDGKVEEIAIESYSADWDDQNLLSINGYPSLSNERPWEFKTQINEPISVLETEKNSQTEVGEVEADPQIRAELQ